MHVHMEPYRWQDRVIEPGHWKADLKVLMLPLVGFVVAGFC